MTVRRPSGRLVVVAVVCALGPLVGCTVTTDDGAESSTSEEVAVNDVWDLREGHDIDRIGWPDDLTGDTFLVEEASELMVELPGDVTIDVTDLAGGPARIAVFRATADGFDERLTRIMRIESPRASVDEIGDLAEDLAERYDLDGSQFGPWARQNPTSGGPDGEAFTPARDLDPGGPTLDLATRVRSGDEAVVAFTVTWPVSRRTSPD